MIFLTAVTWLPGILLLLLQMMFAGNLTFLKANLFLFPAITLFAAVQVLTSSFTMLALSSLSKSRRFVAVMYAGTDLLHGGDVPGAARHHRQPGLGVHLARATCST